MQCLNFYPITVRVLVFCVWPTANVCVRGHAHQFAGAIWPWTLFECER